MLTEQILIVDLRGQKLQQEFPEKILADPVETHLRSLFPSDFGHHLICSIPRSQHIKLRKYLLSLPDPAVQSAERCFITFEHSTPLTKAIQSAFGNGHYSCDLVAVIDDHYKNDTCLQPNGLESFGSIFYGVEFVCVSDLAQYLASEAKKLSELLDN